MSLQIMGNIQERISNATPLSQYPELKHTEETRADSEIQITNRLAFLLSDLNTKRIMANPNCAATEKLDWSNYVFVCVQGFPAIKDEFAFMKLPGEQIYFSGFLFSENAERLSQQEKQKAVRKATLVEEAKNLHAILQSINRQKNIVFVYHSAGNFFLSMYFFYYGKQWLGNRVKGMIDVAGAPLRYYLSARMLTPPLYKCDAQEILRNGDALHKFFTEALTKMGFSLGFKNKYHTLAFLYLTQSPNYGELFQTTRHHPQVLKCIIYGRKDPLFETPLLNQKALYFAYQRELNQQYQKNLLKKYYELYKIDPNNKERTVKNIQERFILAIPRGQHSVHTQPRNQELIAAAVQQYLHLIHQ